MEQIKKEVKESFVYIIILLGFAIVLFINPDNFLQIAINLFGYISIVWGVILDFHSLRKKNFETNNLARGIIFVLFGIIAILKANLLENFFVIILGGYLIIENANRINVAIILKTKKKKIWSFILEFSIINIILSFLLFLNPIINISSNLYMCLIIIINEILILIENVLILTSKQEKNV